MQRFGNQSPVPLAAAFRLSFFVTLALACACLALAETFFLWWMGYFLVATLILICLAYRHEGRWLLSTDTANRLGMVIAVGAAFWLMANLPRSEEDLQATGVPWPAGLLPHLGPLLLVLLLVKLFRPKRLADFWVIQTIGLMMVTLGLRARRRADVRSAAGSVFGQSALVAGPLLLGALVRRRRTAIFRRLATMAAKLPLFAQAEGGLAAPVPVALLGLGRVTRWIGAMVPLGLSVVFGRAATGQLSVGTQAAHAEP